MPPLSSLMEKGTLLHPAAFEFRFIGEFSAKASLLKIFVGLDHFP
jgi:hypothetical protein